MDRIVLFDIDKTLFDREKFLDEFFSMLVSKFDISNEHLIQIKYYYEEIKLEFGFFNPNQFLGSIYKNFPELEGKLDYFFSSANLQEFLYTDSTSLFNIKNFRIGIFSKGDLNFQKEKIIIFEKILEEKLIYIFHNKIEKLQELINSHSDSEIFIVDDSVDVLITAKDINESITTILIDRKYENIKTNGIDYKTNNLFDIISILNKSG